MLQFLNVSFILYSHLYFDILLSKTVEPITTDLVKIRLIVEDMIVIHQKEIFSFDHLESQIPA